MRSALDPNKSRSAATGGRTILLCLALVLAGLFNPASAAVVPLTLEQMVAVSDAVVTVRVEKAESTIKMGKITTAAELQVLESLKGKEGDQLTLHYLGGKHGKLVMLVPELPSFTAGEEAILFLSKPIDRLPKSIRSQYDQDSPILNSYSVVGGFQGKLGIVNLGADGAPVRKGRDVVPSNAKVTRAQAGGARADSGAQDYEAVRSAILELVREQKAAEIKRGPTDTIRGINGRFAVPSRSDNAVVRSFDPLPALAYKSKEEVDKLKADIKAAEEARAARSSAPESPAETSQD